MGSGARLFQAKSGDWCLHDPDIGLLVRVVPMEMAQEALQSRSGERTPLHALYRAGAYHAAYRMVVQDLRRAAVALLRRIEEKTGRIFPPHSVLIDNGSSQNPSVVSLREFVNLPASPLASRLLEAQMYTNWGEVRRDFSGSEMRESHGLLQKIRVAIRNAGDAGEQVQVWLDREAPRRSLLGVYPFFDPLDGPAWEYAQKVVPSIAENLGFLEASGFFEAVNDWLRGLPDVPLKENKALKHFGLGFGYPEDAQGGAWGRIVVYYYDHRLASLSFWPPLGKGESPDDLHRYGLSLMVPLR